MLVVEVVLVDGVVPGEVRVDEVRELVLVGVTRRHMTEVPTATIVGSPSPGAVGGDGSLIG
jgi:hypothetical protein